CLPAGAYPEASPLVPLPPERHLDHHREAHGARHAPRLQPPRAIREEREAHAERHPPRRPVRQNPERDGEPVGREEVVHEVGVHPRMCFLARSMSPGGIGPALSTCGEFCAARWARIISRITAPFWMRPRATSTSGVEHVIVVCVWPGP